MLWRIPLYISFITLSSTSRILSFGGNGMIGSETLHQLLQKKNYNITMIHRGNWLYDSKVRIQPFVTPIICDRNKVPNCDNCSINALKNCTLLNEIIEEAKNDGEGFEAVLDFSAYEPKWVHDAIDILKGVKVGLYIYISSDAVYEVSAPKSTKRLSKEEDAVRPKDPKLRTKLQKEDPYGNAKLAGEEALTDQNEFPYVIFRYADVIGPRDSTRRFAFYHTWLKFYEDIGIPFHIPNKVENVEESITYVEDAVQMIVQTLELGKPQEVWNEAYNIATDNVHSLRSFVQQMAHFMNVSIGSTDGNDNNLFMYPTVFSGGMDVSKAKNQLNFHPTDFVEALKSTIDWYEHEFVHNYDYREEMVGDIMARIVPREKRDKVYLAIDRELSKAGVEQSSDWYKAKRKGDLEFFDKYEKFDKINQPPVKEEL